MTMKNFSRIATAALALGALAVPASAQWGPEEEKNCRSHGAGSLTLAGQAASGLEDSSKLQQFETIPKGVFVPCATFSWTNDKSYFVDVRGTKLGLDDQFASIFAGKKGGTVLSFVWNQNPNWMSNTAQTPYSTTIAGNTAHLHVPDGMRQALQNVYVPWVTPTASNPVGTGTAPANPTVPGFYAVQPWVEDAPGVELRTLRKSGRVGIEIPVGADFLFNASYARETRDGAKNTTFYGGPDYEVATPIQFATDDFRFEAEYAKKKLFANASLNFSNFNNKVEFVEIDNPERLEMYNPTNGRAVINDVDYFRLWQAPDNKAYTLDLTAGYALPARNKITASLSTGNMTSGGSLLPTPTTPTRRTGPPAPAAAFTVNPPYGSVAPRFDTFMFNLRWTGDPSQYFGYLASYRKYDLSDKTDEYTFTSSARGDVGASYSAAGFTREAEGWAVESLRGEVHVLPVRGLRLGLSYGQDKRSYDAREYADVKDDVLTFTGDYTFGWAQLHGAWTQLDRKPGSSNADAIQPTWEGATQTDITERKRHQLSGMLTLTPTARLAVSLTGQKQTNDFAESVTGLLDQEFNSYGVDVTYTATDKLNFMAGYVYEKYFFDMAAAYIPRGSSPPYDPANLWGNQTTDKVDTIRAGFGWTIVPEKLTLDATYDYTKPRSDSLYDFAAAGTPIGGLNEANGIFPANVPALAGFPVTSFDRFPQVMKKFTMAKIRLNYDIAKNLSAALLYWKQKYDNEDWQTENLQPYMALPPSAEQSLGGDPGANRWFFLGARIPSYDADIFRVSLTYKF
jgi:MtrB/PioB family decaheme-associated outer membrane protein